MLKFLGFVSLFVGGTMLFATMGQGDLKKFSLQIIFGPTLIYLGFKILM